MSLLYTNPAALEKCDVRDSFDFYPTPMPLVVACMRVAATSIHDRPTTFLDVGCGTGVWCGVAKTHWPTVHTVGIDVRDDTAPNPMWIDEYQQADYLQLPAPTSPYSMTCGNPPYKHARAMVEKMWNEVAPGGVIGLFLLLNFLEGQERRKNFWPVFPLHSVWISAKRPSFRPNKHGKNGTDARAYAFFVWKKPDVREQMMRESFRAAHRSAPLRHPAIHWLDW